MPAKEQDIQRAEKRGLAANEPEQTEEGLVFQPAVDIFEGAETITILADMPGVTPDQLRVDLRDGVLTIRGRLRSPEGEQEADVLREFAWGSYYRQFSLAETIDQTKIEARLNDGVLRLELPKIEKAKPRRITVNAG